MNTNFRKFISINLVLGILFSNSFIDVYSGTLSPDTRYETFNEDDIRIDEVLENDTVDVELGGNTLVNLYDAKNITPHSGITVSNGLVTAKNVNSEEYLNMFNSIKPESLKANTEYTLVVRVYENTISVGTTADEKFANGLIVTSRVENDSDVFYSDNPYSPYRTFQIMPGETGVFKTLIHTKDDITTDKHFVRTYMCDKKKSSSSKVSFSMVLVEGNHLHRDIDYFEGLKSVGQKNTEGQGFKVVSRGKNWLPNSSGWENGQIKKGGSLSTDEVYYTSSIATKDYIRLKGGVTYTFSYPSQYQLAYHTWDVHYNYISDSGWIKSNTITPASDCYIKVTTRKIGSYDGTLEQAQSMPTYPSHVGNELTVQLEEGSVATKYESQLISEKEIKLKEPLRSLQNGVKDRIIKKDGKWYIERNCGEITLNGSENWRLGWWDTTHINSFDLDLPSAVYPNEGAYVSDKYITKKRDGDNSINPDALRDTIVSGIDGQLYFALKKSTLTTRDLSVFKNWLSKNNFTVVYQLKTPYYEVLDVPLTIDLYTGTTQIFNSTSVPPSMKVVVDRVANRAKEFTQKATENPTRENISLARMWINLMKESALKDEMQINVDDIDKVADIEVEDKKTISANVDLYIKPTNALSMSLSTNIIMFENYSGVDDIEILDALSISVNSSLPYDLNVSIPSPIYNNDKTDTLDVKTLNIRENSKTSYQQFTGINDRLVLKSDCQAATNNVHHIDLKLSNDDARRVGVYKAVLKFEAQQR